MAYPLLIVLGVAVPLVLAACSGSSAATPTHEPATASPPTATSFAPARASAVAAVPPPGSATPASIELPWLMPALPTPPPQQLCLVTRDRGVPESLVPPDLVTLPQGAAVSAAVQMRRESAQALQKLLDGARAQRIYLIAVSGYRSAEQQRDVLNAEIKLYGPAKAHGEVADPGHSEHQLGDAVDVLAARDPSDLDQAFGDSPEGQWLAQHAPEYGFVISYPKGKDSVTGYIYEPWHIRYVGIELAPQIVASGETLTEYLPAHNMASCAPLIAAAAATPAPPSGTPSPRPTVPVR